jgi:hypothetical protein
LNQVGVKATLRYVKRSTLSKARADNQVYTITAASGSFSVPDAGAVVPDKFAPDSDENYKRATRWSASSS